jgi:hypothetical protein
MCETPPFALHPHYIGPDSSPSPIDRGLPVDRQPKSPIGALSDLARSSRDAARTASAARRSSWARRRVSAHRLSSAALSAVRSARSSASAARCAFQLSRPSMAPACTMQSFPATSDTSHGLVDRRRREAGRPVRPAHPRAETLRPNRRPEDLRRSPQQPALLKEVPASRMGCVRTQTRRYGMLRMVGWEGASRATRTERWCPCCARWHEPSARRPGMDTATPGPSLGLDLP